MLKKIVIISNQAYSLANFRGGLIQLLILKKYVVYVLAPSFTQKEINELEGINAIPIKYELQRNSLNIFSEFKTIYNLFKITRMLEVDVVLTYAIKPIVYIGLMLQILNIEKKINMIEGLGYYYAPKRKFTVKNLIIKGVINLLYSLTLNRYDYTLFLNKDDRAYMLKKKIIKVNKTVLIGGIGVNFDRYSYQSVSQTSPVKFLMIARILEEKGIIEYLNASNIITKKYKGKAIFELIGGVDENPGSIEIEVFKTLLKKSNVYWHGQQNSIEFIKNCSVFVLPSYREGLPRSTQEAMATGRAVITTDAPGCRETVDNGINGYLVPIMNHEALAEAMEKFIIKPQLVNHMGANSFKKAEKIYDEKKINKLIYNLIET